MSVSEQQWISYTERYRKGEWRSTIFRDMVLSDLSGLTQKNDMLSILDIGCGHGFDGSSDLQRMIAHMAADYIGVEPDPEIALDDTFTQKFRCTFEDAPLEKDSVDIAFAVMVLEHLDKPEAFWEKLNVVLKKGGVFWGFTMDARHIFVFLSVFIEKIGLKNWYLDKLHGRRGDERYENYGVYYRSNSPHQMRPFTTSFSKIDFINFSKIGELDNYIPKKLQWLGRTVDRIIMRLNLPGSVLAVRVEK
jgi:SAM-dependent methyltransferase